MGRDRMARRSEVLLFSLSSCPVPSPVNADILHSAMGRTTRSGKIFTPYADCEVVTVDVDVEDLLRLRFAELDALGDDASDQDDNLEGSDGDEDRRDDASDNDEVRASLCETLLTH